MNVYTSAIWNEESRTFPKIRFLSRNISLSEIYSIDDLPRTIPNQYKFICSNTNDKDFVSNSDIVLCSSDTEYFIKYGFSTILSHYENKIPIHYHIENVSDTDVLYHCYRLFELVPRDYLSISITIERNIRNTDSSNFICIRTSAMAYQTVVRFLIAEWFLERNKSVTIVDSDLLSINAPKEYEHSVILNASPKALSACKKFENIKDISPDNELCRTSICANVSYIKNDSNGIRFLQQYNETLERMYLKYQCYFWGIDQNALFMTYCLEHKNLNIRSFRTEDTSVYKSTYLHMQEYEESRNSIWISPHRTDRWFSDTLWCKEVDKYRKKFYEFGESL